MKSKFLSLTLAVIILQTGLTEITDAQTVWKAGSLTFTKADYADPTLPANQDRISAGVWITRADSRGIYNIFKESGYISYSSPGDTEWAFGLIDNFATLTYSNWEDWCSMYPPGTVNQDAVLHLKSENIYLAIKFLSWSIGASGGGFSYQRTTQVTLPVNFLSFSAQSREQKITLNWVTAQEQNSKSFGIEHSTDGLAYNSIGSVAASGNSNNNRSYSFIHNTPAYGNNYYRLKQIDLDNNYKYSKTVTVTLENREVNISFNPTSAMISLSNSTGNEMLVQVLTSNGVLLKKEKYASRTASLNIQGLPTGMYIVRVITSGNTYTKQIFKH
jgi:hypothetical protein